ncbi:MGMT family protein [Vulcanisaeta distributa]|uniref:MGMT family protein n=1 Tax=Vulcanisaeta distributa TaxID=164451 RepID=UPI000AC4E31B|nr:MGMT family protein [Vulcanisaeta distributa]
MRCITLLLSDVGALEVCIYGDRIREVRVRVGTDGINRETISPIGETIMRYIMGLVKPQEIIRHLELSPGLLGLAQVAMLSIPRGKVATYAQLARLLNTSQEPSVSWPAPTSSPFLSRVIGSLRATVHWAATRRVILT